MKKVCYFMKYDCILGLMFNVIINSGSVLIKMGI